MNKLDKIIEGNSKYIKGNYNFIQFYHVYKRYTHFSKETIKETISNKHFDVNIKVKINNYGDFLGNIYLHILLPKVHLDNFNQSLNLFDPLNTNYLEKLNLLSNYENYSSFIINAYRFLKTQLHYQT